MRLKTSNILMINVYQVRNEPILKKIDKGKSEFDSIAFILFLDLGNSFLIFDI